jgi:hypothetical protein
MRIIVILAVIMFGQSNCSPVFAAPCYGTGMPNKDKASIGLQENAAYKKTLKADYGQIDSQQTFFLLSWGFAYWFCFDGKIGMGDLKYHPRAGQNIYYKKGFAGGYGFRVKAYDQEKNRVVFGFQHISVHPFANRVDDIRHKAIFDDWQFSFLVSHDFSKITPYIGIKAERADYLRWINKSQARNRGYMGKSAGLVLGFDLPVSKKVCFNIEGQFFNGKAGSAAIKYDY